MNPIFAFRLSFLTPLGLSLRLAVHEWASALCQCFALSAVVLPILLLIGLKNGIIESERQRLMNDPDALLLTPRITNRNLDFTSVELHEISNIKGIRVVLPQLSHSASQVYIKKSGQVSTEEEKQTRVQITLTRPKDITLEHYQCPVPTFHAGSMRQEVVLNDAAGKILGAKVGDEFDITPRISMKNLAPLTIHLTVIGILPPENKSKDERNKYKIFLAEELGFELMNHSIGFPSGFSGAKLTAPLPLCKALLLVPVGAQQEPAERPSPEQLLEHAQQLAQERRWLHDFSLQQHMVSEHETVSLFQLPEGSFSLMPQTGNETSWEHLSLADDFLAALQSFAGEGWRIYRWNPTLPLISRLLSANDDATVSVPWNHPQLLEELSRQRIPGRCSIYTGSRAEQEDAPPDFSRKSEAKTLDINILPHNSAKSNAVVDVYTVPGLPVSFPDFVCAPEDLSLLSLAHYTDFSWDCTKPPHEAFSLPQRSFSFRCYAQTIDDVAFIEQELKQRGVDMISSYEDIDKFNTLNDSLQSLLILVGSLAGAGAIIALVFNLFNATERRKKDYAILRTLGLGRLALLTLPVYETAIIMALTLALSFGIYHGVNALMPYVLPKVMSQGGPLCFISLQHQLIIGGFSMLLAVLAALLSSLRLCRLSPAAYIRES